MHLYFSSNDICGTMSNLFIEPFLFVLMTQSICKQIWNYEGSSESRVIYSLAPGIMFFLSVCPKLFKSQGSCCPFGVPGGLCRVWMGGCSQCAGSPVSIYSHFCPLSSTGHSLQNPRGSQGECIHQQKRPRLEMCSQMCACSWVYRCHLSRSETVHAMRAESSKVRNPSWIKGPLTRSLSLEDSGRGPGDLRSWNGCLFPRTSQKPRNPG